MHCLGMLEMQIDVDMAVVAETGAAGKGFDTLLLLGSAGKMRIEELEAGG